MRHHHERWDGTGYPDRLAGESIPVSARLMALADVFDLQHRHADRCLLPDPETGERINATIVNYLKFARAFNAKFPGFETDIHGLVKQKTNGATEYFMDCVRSRKEPNLGAELGYKVMTAIRMGVDAYRQQTTIKWDPRKEKALVAKA